VPKGSGGGKTPIKLVELLNDAIDAKSQSSVERETGLSHSMISRYKRGIGEPTTETLKKLADYFEIAVWELRGDVAKPGVSFDDEDYDAVLDTSDFLSFGKRVFNIMSLGGSVGEKYHKIREVYFSIVAKKCDFAAKQAGSEAKIYIDEKGTLTVERPNGKKTTFITDL